MINENTKNVRNNPPKDKFDDFFSQTQNYLRRFLRIKIMLLVFFLVWYYKLPNNIPNPIFQHDFNNKVNPQITAFWNKEFVILKPISKFHVKTNLKNKDSVLFLTLKKQSGNVILKNFPVKLGFNTFACGHNIATGVYEITINIEKLTGKFNIQIGDRESFTFWHRTLILIAISLFYNLFKPLLLFKFSKEHYCGFKYFRANLVGLSFAVLYILLHESGHAIASICFGNFSFGDCDFLGLSGHPHSGVDMAILLLPWQTSVQSLAGPIFPTIVGNLFFWGGKLKFSVYLQTKFPRFSTYCSFLTILLLLGQFGMFLGMFGLYSDGDYNGFINNTPFSRSVANLFLVIIASVNGYVIYKLILSQKLKRQH